MLLPGNMIAIAITDTTPISFFSKKSDKVSTSMPTFLIINN